MLNYKVRLENLEDSMWARNVYIMTFSNSLFKKSCVRFSSEYGLGRMNMMNEDWGGLEIWMEDNNWW